MAYRPEGRIGDREESEVDTFGSADPYVCLSLVGGSSDNIAHNTTKLSEVHAMQESHKTLSESELKLFADSETASCFSFAHCGRLT
eukprot:860405-Rhodomonas_salina.1